MDTLNGALHAHPHQGDRPVFYVGASQAGDFLEQNGVALARLDALQDGKLYLFSDRETLRLRREAVAGNVARASQAWPAVAAARA